MPLSSHATRLRRMLGVLGWVTAVCVGAGRARAVAVLACTLAGILGQAAAFGVVLLFINVQRAGEPLVFAGVTIPSRLDLAAALAWVGLVLVAAFVAAACAYLGESLSLTLGRSALDAVQRRGLAGLGRMHRIASSPARQTHVEDAARRALGGDAISFLRVSMLIPRLIVATVSFLVFFAGLFMLDTRLTLVVIGVLALALAPLAVVNVRLVKAARAYEDTARGQSSVLRRTLDLAAAQSLPGSPTPPWIDAYLDHPLRHRAFNALRQILLARRRVGLVQNLLFGAVIATALVLYIASGRGERDGWGPLLAYLIAFRIAAGHLTTTLTLLTGFNRFHAKLARLAEFLRAADAPVVETAADPAAATDRSPRLRVVDTPLPGSAADHRLEPGTVTYLLTPRRLTAYALPMLCRRMTRGRRAGARLLSSLAFTGDLWRPPAMPLSHLMTGEANPGPERRERLRETLAAWGLAELVSSLPGGLDTVMGEEELRGLPPDAAAALALIPGFLADASVLFVSWSGLNGMSAPARNDAIERLRRDAAVVLAGSRPHAPVPAVASAVVVAADDGVSGIGPPAWFAALDARQLEERGFTAARTAVAVPDDDDEDDEEWMD
ncbi:MAG: ABC transporter ATP-binding protein [Phycisphaerales bacterium]|nr:ABC transporter ATP-binding protein [Phycisphaerales bacterium]